MTATERWAAAHHIAEALTKAKFPSNVGSSEHNRHMVCVRGVTGKQRDLMMHIARKQTNFFVSCTPAGSYFVLRVEEARPVHDEGTRFKDPTFTDEYVGREEDEDDDHE